jgi:[citrate (pro-3S)-lyase] ligase
MGPDNIFGHGVPDSGTVASHLQDKLNELIPKKKIAVVNMGRFLWPRQYELLHLLNSLSVKDGDIIIFCASLVWDVQKLKAPQLDLSALLQHPHDYGEVFIDKVGHLNENGNRAVADALFKALQENYFRFFRRGAGTGLLKKGLRYLKHWGLKATVRKVSEYAGKG